MMGKPTTLKELVDYLELHSCVRQQCDDPRIEDAGVLRFVGTRDGGLWFSSIAGPNVYLPIDCGMTSSESGVELNAEGFAITKFGITIRYLYTFDPRLMPGPGRD
jgi:hypothetical protein